jgi:hypothetical protein
MEGYRHIPVNMLWGSIFNDWPPGTAKCHGDKLGVAVGATPDAPSAHQVSGDGVGHSRRSGRAGRHRHIAPLSVRTVAALLIEGLTINAVWQPGCLYLGVKKPISVGWGRGLPHSGWRGADTAFPGRLRVSRIYLGGWRIHFMHAPIPIGDPDPTKCTR